MYLLPRIAARGRIKKFPYKARENCDHINVHTTTAHLCSLFIVHKRNFMAKKKQQELSKAYEYDLTFFGIIVRDKKNGKEKQ